MTTRKKFPGGRIDQRLAQTRREIAWAVLSDAEYRRWRTTRWLRRRPLWLWDRVHHALCVAPPEPRVLIRLVTCFGVDGGLWLQVCAELGPPGRLALAEVLAPKPARDLIGRGPPWGSPWNTTPWRIGP